MYSFETLTPAFIAENESALLALAADQPDEYWRLENFLADLPAKWELSFVVLAGRRLVGYAVLSRRDLRTVHLHHFMVCPEARGTGVGGLMMAEVERRAESTGACFLTLKYRSDNERVRRFYERFGLVVSGPLAPYRFMSKPLG